MSSSRRPCSPSPSSSSPTTSPSTAAPTWTSRATWPRASPSSDGGAPGRPPGRRSRPPLVARRHRHQGDRGAAPQDRRLPLRVRRRRERGASAEAAVTWGSVLAAAALAPLMLRDPGVGARSAMILVLLGTVQIAAAQALFLRGLHHVSATRAALVTMLEPVANPLWVLLVLGEAPSGSALLGGAIVLGAIAWRTLGAPAAAPAIGALD